MSIRIWQHKKTKQKVRVTPWWGVLPGDEIFCGKLGDLQKQKNKTLAGLAFKIGAIVQVGWLLENEHGVWLGVGPTAKRQFKDLGEAQEPKVKKCT